MSPQPRQCQEAVKAQRFHSWVQPTCVSGFGVSSRPASRRLTPGSTAGCRRFEGHFIPPGPFHPDVSFPCAALTLRGGSSAVAGP
jgi:hypothetical protein